MEARAPYGGSARLPLAFFVSCALRWSVLERKILSPHDKRGEVKDNVFFIPSSDRLTLI
jgi:hypothetical protein